MTAQGWGVTPQAKCFTYRQIIDIMGNSFHAVSCTMALLAALATAGYDHSWRESYLPEEPSPLEEDQEAAPGQALGSDDVEVVNVAVSVTAAVRGPYVTEDVPYGCCAPAVLWNEAAEDSVQDSGTEPVRRNLTNIRAAVGNGNDADAGTEVLVPESEIGDEFVRRSDDRNFLDAQPSKRIPLGLRGYLADSDVVSRDGELVSPAQSAVALGDRPVIDLD